MEVSICRRAGGIRQHSGAAGVPAVCRPTCRRTIGRIYGRRGEKQQFNMPCARHDQLSSAVKICTRKSGLTDAGTELNVVAMQLRAAATDAAPPQAMLAPYLEGAPQYCSCAPLEPGGIRFTWR